MWRQRRMEEKEKNRRMEEQKISVCSVITILYLRNSFSVMRNNYRIQIRAISQALELLGKMTTVN